MNGRAQVSGLALSPGQVPDLNWRVRGAGDFNGDFQADLIWQNEATGQIAAWLMEGTTRPDENGRLLSPFVVEYELADRRRRGLRPGRPIRICCGSIRSAD